MAVAFDRCPGNLSIAIITRIPILLLTALYALIVSRQGGQISALFETLNFPGDHLLLFAITLVTVVVLAVLTGPSSRVWRWVDLALFAAPVILFITLFFEAAVGPIILATAAIGAAILSVLAIRRLPSPGWRITALMGLLIVAIWTTIHMAIEWSPVSFPRAMGSTALVFAFLGLGAAGLQLLICLRAVGIVALVGLAAVFFTNEHGGIVTDRPPLSGPGEC